MATSPMAEEPFDTYIDFGFEDEASSVVPPAVAQNPPDWIVEILAALQSGPPLSQAEEPTNASSHSSVPAPLSAAPSQSTSTFYHPFPALSRPLGSASEEVCPATCVRPSDTVYTHGAPFVAPTPPVPSPHQYVPLISPRLLRAKRPQEQSEDSSRPEPSSPRKRKRTVPPLPSLADAGHSSDPSHILVAANRVAAREPVVQSTTWGILPGLGNNAVAGPSTIHVENVLGPQIPRKRARNDENSDRSPSSNKRHKMVTLAAAPEVLNAPPATYPRLYSGDEFGLLPALAGGEPPATRFVSLPELTPEFYKELCDVAFEIAQGLRQSSSIDVAYTYQDVPGSSITYPVVEDNKDGPPATTMGKRRRSQAPPEQPPQRRQRTSDSSTNATTPEKPFGCPFAACPQRVTREADVIRHIRTKHLGVKVFCTNPEHSGPVRVVREDGVFRHLACNTCIGAEARAKLVEKWEKELRNDKDAWTRRWRARVHRKVSEPFTDIPMPCYTRDGRFAAALEHLPGWSPDRLEKWFSSYGTVRRCVCERCEEMSDAEFRGEVKIQVEDEPGGINRSRSASPVPGPSSAGAGAPAARPSVYSDMVATPDDAEWDDKLPPEEEEGVDEDLPQAPPLVADTVVVPDDDDAGGTADTSEDVGNVCPELQAVYDILSELSDADLESLFRSLNGSQAEANPSPEGKIDA